MKVSMDDLRWVRALREEQHHNVPRRFPKNWRRMEVNVRCLEGPFGHDSSKSQEYLTLAKKVMFTREIDSWLRQLDTALSELEVRHARFFSGRPTQLDRGLARGLAYFPQCLSPLLDYDKHHPIGLLKRQQDRVASLMARHYVLVTPPQEQEQEIPS